MSTGTAAAQQRVLTPSAATVVRRSLFWLAVAAFVGIIAVIVLGGAGAQSDARYLDSSNAAPNGARAVTQVLAQHGVRVTATSSLADTRSAIDDPASTTLFLYDGGQYLDARQLRAVATLAHTVIIADAAFAELRAVAPELAQAGHVGDTLVSDCELAAVRKAGTVTTDGNGYRVVKDGPEVTACLGSGDGVYSLIQIDRRDSRLLVLGASSALTNEHVLEEGNAALALNLLGADDRLIWYTPSAADLPATAPRDLGSLTPAWVTPALGLLVLAFVAGAIWRGRRFGPLVRESLPVVVRASETMLGRARLYQRSAARLRALDALRIGSLHRLAALCGLPRAATVDHVVASVAGVTGDQLASVRRLLVDAAPASDAELVALSDQLLELERRVASAVRP